MMIFAIVIGQVEITPANYPQFTESLHWAFVLFTVMCLAGIFFSLARGKTERARGWWRDRVPPFLLSPMTFRQKPENLFLWITMVPRLRAPPGHGGARELFAIFGHGICLSAGALSVFIVFLVPCPPRGRPFGGGGSHRMRD